MNISSREGDSSQKKLHSKHKPRGAGLSPQSPWQKGHDGRNKQAEKWNPNHKPESSQLFGRAQSTASNIHRSMTAGKTKTKKLKDKQKTCSAGNVEPKAKASKSQSF